MVVLQEWDRHAQCNLVIAYCVVDVCVLVWSVFVDCSKPFQNVTVAKTVACFRLKCDSSRPLVFNFYGIRHDVKVAQRR